MNKISFIFFIGIILLSLCFVFACEQTVENSDEDDSTPAGSSSASSESSDASSSSDSSASSSSEISSDSSSTASFAYQDDFSGYSTASPWTPAGGWTASGSAEWSIVAAANGNGVQNGSAITSGKLVSSYSGTDYTVAVKFRPAVITDGFGFGIFSRMVSPAVFYAVEVVYMSAGDITRIAIYKFNSGNGAAVMQTYTGGQLDTGTYYTLQLQVVGTVNPVLVAFITDGTNAVTLPWTDDGTQYGPQITSAGNAGIWTGGAGSIIFDDFTVTEPL